MVDCFLLHIQRKAYSSKTLVSLGFGDKKVMTNVKIPSAKLNYIEFECRLLCIKTV